MRFLVDECLSPALVKSANGLGYEAHHVAHRQWSGLTDGQLLKHVIDEDLTLVTNNREDFTALYECVELHPGLIVILPNVRRGVQVELFEVAVASAAKLPSMINKVVEVDRDGSVSVRDIPPPP